MPTSSGRTILIFVRYYLPGYKAGGPIRTISNMVDTLGDEFNFKIVTSDRDASDRVPYATLGSGTGWQKVGKASVLYLSPSQKRFCSIVRIICETEHDTIYLNSLFDPDFTLKPLFARRMDLIPNRHCVVAARGELSEGALQLKASKKRIFLKVAKMIGLYQKLVWQASSVYEAKDISSGFGSVAKDIRIAPNLGSAYKPVEDGTRDLVGRKALRVIFLSRVSPMKNLDYALRVLQRVRVPVQFDVFGQVDNEAYWRRCLELIHSLPSNVVASYRGSVPHEEVFDTISRYDLFFLPTRGENYGHAILEALSAGTPVLISDTTPWRSLSEKNIGWDIPLSRDDEFVRIIQEYSMCKISIVADMRRRAAEFAKSTIRDESTIEANKRLFITTCDSRF